MTNNDTKKLYSLSEIEVEQDDIYILEDGGYIDVVLAGLSILVTAILGYVTYVQTKEAMKLDSIDKTPYFQISNFHRFEEINSQEYHIGSPHYIYVPSLKFVICDTSGRGLVFKLLLTNVTENTSAKANVYYMYHNEEEKVSYKEFKRIPIAERLEVVVENANKRIEEIETLKKAICKKTEHMKENDEAEIELVDSLEKEISEIVVARDEAIRIQNGIPNVNTPNILDCKKEEKCQIELVTYFDKGEDVVSKYLNGYVPVNFHIAVDMETIHGYRYTQVIFLALRYANTYSIEDDSQMRLVFAVEDFESKVISGEFEKVNWKKDFYKNRMSKTSENKK